MYGKSQSRRIWVSGHQVEIWEHPSAGISVTPSAIEGYAHAGRWEAAFNALVLLGDSEPRGMA